MPNRQVGTRIKPINMADFKIYTTSFTTTVDGKKETFAGNYLISKSRRKVEAFAKKHFPHYKINGVLLSTTADVIVGDYIIRK